MPRLPQAIYLHRRQFLCGVLQQHAAIFSILPIHEQWRLHEYYQTQVDADDASLLTGRKGLTRAQPSLPQAAGKAFHRLRFSLQLALDHADGDELRLHEALNSLARSNEARVPVRGERTVLIRPLARPELDVDRFAAAILRLAEELDEPDAAA